MFTARSQYVTVIAFSHVGMRTQAAFQVVPANVPQQRILWVALRPVGFTRQGFWQRVHRHHGIKLRAKEEGKSKTILFNLSGHGFVDMMAYADFQTGILDNHHLSDEQIEQSLEKIAALQPEKELIV